MQTRHNTRQPPFAVARKNGYLATPSPHTLAFFRHNGIPERYLGMKREKVKKRILFSKGTALFPQNRYRTPLVCRSYGPYIKPYIKSVYKNVHSHVYITSCIKRCSRHEELGTLWGQFGHFGPRHNRMPVVPRSLSFRSFQFNVAKTCEKRWQATSCSQWSARIQISQLQPFVAVKVSEPFSLSVSLNLAV